MILSPGIGLLTAHPAPAPDVGDVGRSLPNGLVATSAVWNGADGVAYVFGGTQAGTLGPEASRSVLKFDPASSTDPIPQVDQLPDADLDTPVEKEGRTATSAVWAGSATYVFGGRTNLASDTETDYVAQIVRFHPQDGTDIVGNFSSGRSNTAAAIADDGTAYVFGGLTGSGTPTQAGRTDEIKAFDTASRSASDAGTLPKKLANATAVWDSERDVAYIFGGDTRTGNQDAIWQFDPDGDPKVSMLPVTLTAGRVHASSVMTSHGAIVFGGRKADGTALATADRFLPETLTTDGWHDLPDPKRSGTSAAFDGDGNAYIFGGEDDGGNRLDDIVNYTVAPITHHPNLTHAGAQSSDAVTITGDRTVIQPTFTVRNDHAPCTESNEAGCATEDGLTMSLYVRSRSELESAGIGTGGQSLSEMDAAVLEDKVVNGTWPDANATIPAIPGDETREVTFSGFSITGYDPGQNLTVIGVADWCQDRHINLTDDPCGVDEADATAGVPAEQNIFFDQYLVPPSIDLTTDLQSPLSRDDLKASQDQSTQVLVNVTNLHPRSLDQFGHDEFRLRYEMTDRVFDGQCPDGAKEGGTGAEKCETTIDGPGGGRTVSELIHWASNVGGDRQLKVIVEYPGLAPDHPDAPDNAPVRFTTTDSFYYPAVDWVPGQTVESDRATPGKDPFRVDSTLANVGDLAADETGVDQGVEIGWTRCNRLVRPASGYRCDRTSDDGWKPLNGSGQSTHAFDLSNFPPGGTVEETIFWGTDLQAPGVWRIRSRADNASLWDTLEHSRANNDAVDTVRMTDVSWSDAPRPFEQEFDEIQAGSPLNFNLSLENRASEQRSFEVFRVNASCNPACDGSGAWKFHLLDEDDVKLNQEQGLGQAWYPGGQRSPVEVSDVPAGGSVPLAFRAVPQQQVQPDHFVNATLVVCEADPGFEPDDRCLVNGDLIRIRAFFDPPWNPVIKMDSPSEVSVEQGDTASFFFRVRNGAEEEADAFQLRGIIEPGGAASEPQWTRLDPVSDCPKDDHTVDPDEPDASGKCSTLFRIKMDPGESNRFRMRTTVDESVADGDVINVTLEVTSKKSVNGSGPKIQKTKLLRIGVGTDIAPPKINATPPSGAVVKPGTPIDFDVTDDSGVASVERQIDDGRFQAFPSDDYIVDTAGRPDGDLKIRVRARDDAAREQTKTFRYVVDGTPPAFQAVQVDPSVAFVGGTIDVSVGLSEDNPSSVVAQTAGATYDLTFRSATGLWEADDIPVSNQTGVYSVSVTATDGAGNKRSSNVSYEVVRPDVSIASEDLTAEPRSPTAGETLTVTARLSNPTGADITGYPVVLKVDGETVAQTNATLVANAKTAVTLEWESQAGGHDISVCGDPQETIPDPNRDNQCAQLSVRVRDMGLIPGPEIVIIAASLVLGALGRRRWDARDADERYPRD